MSKNKAQKASTGAKPVPPLGWDGKNVPVGWWRDAEGRITIMEDWARYALAIGARMAHRVQRKVVTLADLGMVEAGITDLITPEQGVLEAKRGK